MRNFFLLAGFFFVFKSHALDTKKDSLYIEAIRKDAFILARKGNLIGSIESIEFAIAESKLAKLPEHFINERLRLFLANRYSNIGDFDRAIELAKNLESFYKRNGDLKNELYVKNNLGVYNQNIGRNSLAYGYFFDGWQTQKGSDEVVDKLDWLDGLSASCIELGRLKEGKMYLAEAKKLLNNCTADFKEELLLYYNVNRSNYAIAIADTILARKFLMKCVRLTEKLNHRKGADAYKLLASISLKQGKNQQALEYAEKMVKLLGADKDTLLKDPYVLQSYLLQAKALLALKKYEAAVLQSKKAEDQAIFFQRQYLFNESKLYIGALRRENLETSVLALYEQYKQSGKLEFLEQALLHADKAKSILLNERWANAKRLSLDKRKDAINLRYKLIFQLNELKKREGSNEIIVLRNKLDSLNNELGVKNDPPFLANDLKAFQNSLKKEEICLQYMVIDTFLFRFDIQKDKIDWNVETLKNPAFIIDFYNILKNPSSTPQEFILASHKLPVLLPFPFLKKAAIKKISIIPDGILNYVLFDALPSNPGSGSWNNIRYAAMDYSFSYQFSIQSSKHREKPKTTGNYIGFAPDYSKSKQWAMLKNSRLVLEQAQGYFKGKTYFGTRASKKKLQEHGPGADILHLYAHGVSNDSSYDASYIILQDGKMYVDEVLALPLKARLCLLTACETGLGKAYKGEGITSIAWAFKAAGAENVLQSMWKLNEQSSQQLMSYFFTHLANETNSSVALTNAKRQYLESSTLSDRLKHPYYWVGIGHYGSGVVLAETYPDWWKVIFGFAVVFGAGLVIWKYSQKPKLPPNC